MLSLAHNQERNTTKVKDMENLELLDFIYIDYEEVSEELFDVVFNYSDYVTSSESGNTDYYRALANYIVYRGKIMEVNHVNHYFIERK